MNLLEHNVFRTLALPATATQKQMLARLDELSALSRVGMIRSFPLDSVWPGACRNAADIEQASETIRNPARLLEHVLFWFWVLDSTDGKALCLLQDGHAGRAEAVWGGHDAPCSHSRNLAILYTLRIREPALAAGEVRHFCAMAARAWRKTIRSPSSLQAAMEIAGTSTTDLDAGTILAILNESLAGVCPERRWAMLAWELRSEGIGAGARATAESATKETAGSPDSAGSGSLGQFPEGFAATLAALAVCFAMAVGPPLVCGTLWGWIEDHLSPDIEAVDESEEAAPAHQPPGVSPDQGVVTADRHVPAGRPRVTAGVFAPAGVPAVSPPVFDDEPQIEAPAGDDGLSLDREESDDEETTSRIDIYESESPLGNALDEVGAAEMGDGDRAESGDVDDEDRDEAWDLNEPDRYDMSDEDTEW